MNVLVKLKKYRSKYLYGGGFLLLIVVITLGWALRQLLSPDTLPSAARLNAELTELAKPSPSVPSIAVLAIAEKTSAVLDQDAIATDVLPPDILVNNAPNDETTTIPATEIDVRIAALNAQLLDERQARQRLLDELSNLQEQVSDLAQRLEQLEPGQQRNRSKEQRQQISTNTFFEAGFDNSTADYLAARWSEQEMALLYLRDQAIREGWADTPQYEQAVRELRHDASLLHEELGDNGYERYLYALGRPNQVQVDAVIDSSPAQVAGLIAGDRIIRYDGQRIYSRQDLRDISTAGDPEALVTVQIERDGILIETTMPRGPLGVMLRPISELSDS